MQKEFLTGNEAIVKGVIAAGAEVMTGYPITPTTEIVQYWAKAAATKPNLKFLQTEDEMSAGFAMIGAVLAGKYAFTATAGPGNVLAQDAFSMAENLRLPTVAFINQRGGPSTGTVIYSQQEVNLTCFGGNGEGLRIVYSVASPQEMYDYAIKAFNTAWLYRYPTFVLSDGYSAKTLTEIETYLPHERNIEMIEPVAYLLNDKKKGSYTNLRNTYNLETELNEILDLNARDFAKISPEIVESESYLIDDAEYVIVAHGIVAAASKLAVDLARHNKLKAGLFRPISLRPFPTKALIEAVKDKKGLLIPESSLGQFERMIKDNLYGLNIPIRTLQRPAMGMSANEIANNLYPLEQRK